MEILKRHWKKIAGPVAIVAILLFAYWYGGNAPGARGFRTETETTQTEAAETEEPSQTEETTAVEASQTEERTTAEISQAEEADTGEAASEAETQDGADTKTDSKESASQSDQNVSTGDSSDKQADDKDTTTQASDSKSQSLDDADATESRTETSTQSAGTQEPVTTQEAVETYTCTISIYCDTVLDNMDLLKESKTSCIPANGCILQTTTVEFTEGDTVFDVLQKVTRDKGIPFDYTYSAVYGSAYIRGINNLYEFDCGNLSGWMYSVNGSFPGYGCSSYVLKDHDVIKWVYTCNLGADVK